MVGKMAMISSRLISCWLNKLCVKDALFLHGFFFFLSKSASTGGYWLGSDNILTPETVTEVLTAKFRVTFLSLKSRMNHHVG